VARGSHELVMNGQEIEKGNRDSERGLRPVGPTPQREWGMNLRQSAQSADKNEKQVWNAPTGLEPETIEQDPEIEEQRSKRRESR
jgi:hypothetical protein